MFWIMKAKENIDQRASIKIIRTKIQNQKQICTIKNNYCQVIFISISENYNQNKEVSKKILKNNIALHFYFYLHCLTLIMEEFHSIE